jgi:hypothetical protein
VFSAYIDVFPYLNLYVSTQLQDHPKDAEFLNCPIRFYTEMEAIFSHSHATGKWALGSGEALGLRANLYLAVMEMPNFPEEALIVAYTFLLDNKAQGRGFVNMSDAHRSLWLRTFLAKNYPE